MTDRVRTLTVIFEDETRDDDAEDIAKLIRCIRGIAKVELGPVTDLNDALARLEIKREIGKEIWELIIDGATYDGKRREFRRKYEEDKKDKP